MAHLRNKLLLLGVGNPLLDITSHVDAEFLAKYKLEDNNAILCGDDQAGIYDDLKKKCEYSCGGATLNTIRVFASLYAVKHPDCGKHECKHGLIQTNKGYFCVRLDCPSSFVAAFTGCVGNDNDGNLLIDLCKKDGVKNLMCQSEKTPTGVCGVCVNGLDRSLCTQLGACNDIEYDTVMKGNVYDNIKEAQIIYSSGFFLTGCAKAMIDIAKNIDGSKGQRFATNLSAPFLIEVFKDDMMALFEYTDIIIGNEDEYNTFKRVHDVNATSIEDVCVHIAKLPRAHKQPRIVVCTQGVNETIVVINDDGNIKTSQHKPDVLPADKIVDTNAAGDAFVGGFLFGVTEALAVEESVKMGHFTAQHVITHNGCDTRFGKLPL